jgi:hypothetical protein
LNLGDYIAASLLIIRCVAFGDTKQDNPNKLAALFMDKHKILSRRALKPGELCSRMNDISFVQRKFEIGERIFGNDECDYVSILGPRISKIDLHGIKQPFRWGRLGSFYRPNPRFG